ncbi:helix-turn-helix domain-containing protein [Candidatus Uhrbacteria bacterium]|nr:helix-turn-helix domain-containing protein [Candidatus Uhrbacteria bacterium]
MENNRQSDLQVRVSVSEAARLFGVNPRTIRRAITGGSLRYIVVRNRYKITFPSLVEWSQTQPLIRQKRDKAGIGQWVDQWRIRNIKYSPRPPQNEKRKP